MRIFSVPSVSDVIVFFLGSNFKTNLPSPNREISGLRDSRPEYPCSRLNGTVKGTELSLKHI